MTDNKLQPIKDKMFLSARARQYLLDLFNDGTYTPGEQLPSETELATQLGISRPTLREALHDLESEGAIIRKHGVGTFVASSYNHRLETGLERLESVLTLARQQGSLVHCTDLLVKVESASLEEANKLQIEHGSALTSISRIIVVDHKPSAFMLDLVPASILPPEDVDSSFKGSVLDLLGQKHDLHAAWAVTDIVACSADEQLAENLNVPLGQALLLLEELLYNAEGLPLEFSLNYFVPNLFRFHLVRR
ncbi:MAG: GntR family transcriptional regulator [Pseudomonadota bacterium]